MESNKPLPIWELASMTQWDYRNLSWIEKTHLIVLYQGLPVFEFLRGQFANAEARKTMNCRFVTDGCIFKQIQGTPNLTWWPHEN